LSKGQTNTDKLFQQKFENFAVAPPEYVWSGVQAGIAAPSFFALYWKGIAAAAVVVLLVAAGILFLTPGTEPKVYDTEKSVLNVETDAGSKEINGLEQEESQIEQESSDIIVNESINNAGLNTEQALSDNNIDSENPSGDQEQKIVDNIDYDKINDESGNSQYPESSTQEGIAIGVIVSSDQGVQQKDGEVDPNTRTINTMITSEKVGFNIYSDYQAQPIPPSIDEASLIDPATKDEKSKWSFGLYFSPEMMLNNFDSIEILANYSLGVEPTYFINDHLFIRFGLGASYSRDRGFAKLDYLSNDLLGTYDYVYDITFDSIDGEVIPTYHTKTAEVWDTIRHLEISSLTNQYIYLQTPLLLGYYNTISNFKWYFYGGPAFNLMVSKQIDQPLDGVEYVEILDFTKVLPERSPYYFQLWIGAGIEYKAGKNLGIAFEPSYRYYFNNVFKEPPYSKSGLSGFSLRIGLIYTIQ